MTGVLLDPRTGRPEPTGEILAPSGLPITMQDNLARGWRIGRKDEALAHAPAHVLELLARSRDTEAARDALRQAGTLAYEPRASMQSWQEVLYAPTADGTQVIASTVETIMVPDFTLPAGYLYAGRCMKYTVIGEMSTVITTPGTVIFSLRYGGVGGTVLATSGAFAPDPTAANTTVTVMVEWYFICRAIGTAAASFTVGRIEWNDYDDASAATIVGNLNMRMAPASGSAAVNINTTTANALSPTVKFSVTTATTQFTAHIAILEALT